MEDTTTQTEQMSSKKGMNPVMVVAAIIVLLVLAGGAYMYMQGQKKSAPAPVENTMQPTTAPTTAMAAEKVIEVDGKNFSFTPNVISVSKGDKVTINFKNVGGFHDFVIDEFNVKTDTIGTGKTATVTFTADKAGTFEYYCAVGNHRAMGMKGTLTVTE